MTVQGLGDDVLSTIVLDGKKFDAHLERNLTADGPLVRSIDQPSSLSLAVDDPERLLLQGGYFGRRADLEIDDLWFRMVSLDKSGDLFTLGFEDREIALLARHKKPRRASRADVTRAEFLRSCVREEPHIAFSCPELHKRQNIAAFSGQDAQQIHDARRDRGIATKATLTVKGNPASPSQIALMNRVLAVAQSVGAGRLGSLAMICANIGEADYDNSAANPTGSKAVGLFQLIPATAKSFGLNPHDVEACAHQFLIGGFTQGIGGKAGAVELARAHPDWTPGHIASAVEGSDQGGSFYDAYAAEAKAIYDAHGGITSTQDSNTGGGAYVQRYEYTRGEPGGPKGEDTWSCGQRLADEVAWRWFCVSGVVYFISDYDLVRSRPRMVLNERSRGVDTIDFSLDDGARIPDTATISGHAARWQAPPGTVVVLDESMGDAAGAWVVTQIERQSLTNSAVTITLGKPKPPHLEPASSVAQRAITASATADGGVNAGDVSGGIPGTVTIAPGANRPGVGLHQGLLDFLGLVAGKTTEAIVVGTGTNHNQFSLSGLQSDHWTGDAGDIEVGGDARSDPAAGSKGDNIATAALVVLGIPDAQARSWATSGALNFGIASTHNWTHGGRNYRVQVGWRTLVGGNHYNHVHIGVKPI